MAVSAKVRREVYEKFDGRCAYCGKEIRYEPRSRACHYQVDHVVPKSRGGTDDIDNLLPACQKCNWWKSDIDLETFRVIQAFIREDVPWFFKKQREWLKLHVVDLDGFVRGLEPHVFYFEQVSGVIVPFMQIGEYSSSNEWRWQGPKSER